MLIYNCRWTLSRFGAGAVGYGTTDLRRKGSYFALTIPFLLLLLGVFFYLWTIGFIVLLFPRLSGVDVRFISFTVVILG